MVKSLFVFSFLLAVLISSYLGFVIATSVSVDSEIVNKLVNSDVKVKALINVDPSLNDDSFSEVLTLIGKENVIRVYGHDSILAFIDRASLDKISSSTSVKSVKAEKSYKQLLQDAVPLIDADLAWQRNVSGVDITGIGQTVCVIDGGINFTHQDLAAKNIASCNLNCEDEVLGCYSDCSRLGDSHGTQVAGIVAADGVIRGVSKGANLVGADVIKDNGNADSGTMRAALDWCVSNATTYDISVISISLGSNGLDFGDYCDDYDPTVAAGIDNAVAAGIPVVVSSGNDGNSTGITSPSCVQSAISVGATNKSDYLATYSNYNFMVKLFAPGSSINSTSVGGKYAAGSGTSFSAPMVSAAIAMINQVLADKSFSLTPQEIEDLLFDNADPIVNLPNTYMRINVDKAIATVLNMSNGTEPMQPTEGNITAEENLYRHLSLNNPNLFFYAPFDFQSANKAVHDFSSNNYDGTVMGGALYKSNCLYGGCFWFDGTNDATDDYLNFSILKNSNKFGNSFTVSIWVNNNQSIPYAVKDIAGNQYAPSAAGVPGWVLKITSGNKAQFTISNGTKVSNAYAASSNILPNQWHHVVAVYDKSVPSVRVYVDGVPGSLISGSNVPNSGGISNTDFRIGATTSFSRIWRGNLDDAMLFDKALNSSDVDSLYKNSTSKFYAHGQKIFTDLSAGADGSEINITLNSSFVYPGISYKIMVGESNGNGYNYGSLLDVVNGRVDNIAVSNSQNVSVAVMFSSDASSVYSPLLIGSPVVVLSNPQLLPPIDANIATEENTYRHLFVDNANLFFYAPFDFYNAGTKKVHDFTNNNYDGTTMGGSKYILNSSCLYGGCFWFDGTNDATDDYLNISTLKNSSKFGNSFTVSTWVYNQQNGTYLVRDIAGTQSSPSAAGVSGWVLKTSSTNKAQFTISNGTKVITASAASSNILPNQWHHVVAVYDKSVPSVRVYVDGVPGTQISGVNVTKSGAISNTEFRIGATTSFSRIWKGKIDETMVFDKALSGSEISTLYANQTVRFKSTGTKIFSSLYGGSVGTMLNVTLNVSFAYPGTSYKIRVGDNNGNGYTYGPEYDVVNGKVIDAATTTPTNASIAVVFNSNANNFYSPLLVGNVTILAY